MIHYLSNSGGAPAMLRYLQGLPSGAPQVQALSYDELWRRRGLASGTYVFTDFEQMRPSGIALALALWERLEGAPIETRLLNHPGRVLRRYRLLRELHAHGINDHRAYRLHEARGARLPVFLRHERVNEERSFSELLWSRGEVLRAARAATRRGYSPRDLLVVEFCDTGDGDGVYHKYGAYIVGDRIVPRLVDFDRHWVVKSPGLAEPTEAQLRLEREYLETNPHEGWLRDVFRIANVDFGRIDYSFENGRPRVWEINTHPDPVHPRRQAASRAPIKGMFDEMFVAALREIDLVAVDRPRLAGPALPTTPHVRFRRRRLVSLAIAARDVRKRMFRWRNRWRGAATYLMLAARWRLRR